MLSDERIREIDAMSPQEDEALNAIQELLREREQLITTIRILRGIQKERLYIESPHNPPTWLEMYGTSLVVGLIVGLSTVVILNVLGIAGGQ